MVRCACISDSIKWSCGVASGSKLSSNGDIMVATTKAARVGPASAPAMLPQSGRAPPKSRADGPRNFRPAWARKPDAADAVHAQVVLAGNVELSTSRIKHQTPVAKAVIPEMRSRSTELLKSRSPA